LYKKLQQVEKISPNTLFWVFFIPKNKIPPTMSIVKNLKAIRNKYGLSQDKFSELMAVTKGMISSYEVARAEPSPDFLLRLSRMIGLPADQILYGIVREEDLPPELLLNGVEDPSVQYRAESNLYDIRNLVEEVKNLRDEVSKLKGSKE